MGLDFPLQPLVSIDDLEPVGILPRPIITFLNRNLAIIRSISSQQLGPLEIGKFPFWKSGSRHSAKPHFPPRTGRHRQRASEFHPPRISQPGQAAKTT